MSSVSGTSSTPAFGYINQADALSAVDGGATTPLTVNGLTTGINTSQIIQALMAQYQLPQSQLQKQLSGVQTNISLYQGINTDAQALQAAAESLATKSGWQQFQATSSSSEVTATAGTGAVGGSLTFSVESLASPSSLISGTSVSSTAAPVASGNLLVAAGGSAYGFGTLADGGGLALGSHTIQVTQSSAGATKAGTSALGATTTIDGTNDTLNYTLDGVAGSLTLAHGTNLTAAQLASAVSTASGGALSASVDAAGKLSLATTAEGSAHSLQITGGNALGVLGLTTDASASIGTDGVVSVDGVSTTVTDASAGHTVSLGSTGSTSVSATLSGGLRTGSLTAAEISTGDGSLGAVVNAINGANVGVTAAAVQTGASAYKLQVSSTATGARSGINISSSAFSVLGAMQTLTAGADAQVKVGTGAGAFTVNSSTNAVTGLMPGVTLNLRSASPGTPVTVSLAADGTGIATQVQSLVTAFNTLSTDLGSVTSYDTTNKKPGALLGDPTATNLLNQILSAVSKGAGANSTGSTGLVGLSLNADGTITFNQATFLSAYNANPTAVANTFTQGATTTSPQVSFYKAEDTTQAGDYQVHITQAAAKATATGQVLTGGTITGPETLTVTSHGLTASYAATTGESLSDIASGLDAAFAAKGVGVNASVDSSGRLQIQSLGYGSLASFQVSSTASGAGSTGVVSAANTPQTFAGQDVQGTINGVAGTGSGQILLGSAKSPAAGLFLQITASAADMAANGGDFGTVHYTPGVAQALATVANNASDPTSGTVSQEITSQQSTVTSLNQEIAFWNPILQEKQQLLQTEYTAMETALAQLQAEKNSLFPSSSSSSSGG